MSPGALIDSKRFSEQTILIAEDNEDDIIITRSALVRAGVSNPLQTVADGEEVQAYLQGTGGFADRVRHPLPVVLLLDLQMPKRGGLEVLEWLRHQPGLRALTVHVLSASGRQADVRQALELGANAYFVKPTKFDELVVLFRAWHQVLQLQMLVVP